MKVEFGTLKKTRSSHLTMVQKHRLIFIRNQKELQILLADKNLEPMVVNVDNHVKAMADQNLSDRNTYESITKEEAHDCF